MQMPGRVGRAICGLLMEAHGVWKRYPEQIVVTNGHLLDNIGQGIALVVAELWYAGHMATCQQQDLEAAASLFDQLKDEVEKTISFLSDPDCIQAAKQQENNKTSGELKTEETDK